MEVGESIKQDLRVETDSLRATVLNKRNEKASYASITYPLYDKLWDASETTAINVSTNPLMRWK